jgi:hypothetical protein
MSDKRVCVSLPPTNQAQKKRSQFKYKKNRVINKICIHLTYKCATNYKLNISQNINN